MKSNFHFLTTSTSQPTSYQLHISRKVFKTSRAKIQIRVNLNFDPIVRGRAVVFLRHFRELFRQTAAWCSTVLKETFIIIFDTIINNEPKLGLMHCIKKGLYNRK